MMLEIINGSFSYRAQEDLFTSVNFRIDQGEIVTVLGPNGVGKTTLLKCVTGLLPWKTGYTLIDGQGLQGLEIWKRISYVPQAHGLVFPFTVFEMVLLGRAPYVGVFSQPRLIDVEKTWKILEEVGIRHLASKSCNEISGGERQLVLIARALNSEPETMILDEPESHLDFRNQLMILSLVERIARERGISSIINTHYPQNALRISDKTLLLGKDRRHFFGKTRQAISEENLRTYFGVDVKIASVFHESCEYKTVYPVEMIQGVV